MIQEAVATGATVEEAKQAAFLALGAVEETEVQFEVMDLPKKKTLGLFGGCPARVRAFVERPDPKTEKRPRREAKKASVKAEEKKATQLQPENAEKKSEKTPKAEKKEKKVAASKELKEIPSEMQEHADAAKEYLAQILVAMGVEEAEITMSAMEEGVEFSIATPSGQGMGAIIGRKGETLDALQHLCSLVFNRGEGRIGRITLNPGNYREKRAAALEDTARRFAQKALENQRSYLLDPMNSYERRIIHTAVQPIDNVESWSIGEGDHRRVCIGVNKGELPPYERKGRGGRDRHSGSRRGRDSERHSRREPYVPQGEARAPRKDAADIPLFGRIDG